MLNVMFVWLIDGLLIGGGMVVVVGYVMVINMMVFCEMWLFFVLGFVLVVVSEIIFIGFGVIGVVMVFIYLNFFKMGGFGNGGGFNIGDFVGDIIDKY